MRQSTVIRMMNLGFVFDVHENEWRVDQLGAERLLDEMERLNLKVRSYQCALLSVSPLLSGVVKAQMSLNLLLAEAREDLSPFEESDDGYEYRITSGQRKRWDGYPDLSKDGWEEWKPWERFDYYEERYWRRKKPTTNFCPGRGDRHEWYIDGRNEQGKFRQICRNCGLEDPTGML